MDAICSELAGTGLNVQYMIMIVAAMLIFGTVTLALRRNNIKKLVILPALVLVVSVLAAPISVSAQAAEDCPPSQSEVPVVDNPDDDDPVTPGDTTITADNGHVMLGSCFAWVLEAFNGVDLVALFSSDGTSPLMAETIDLDPSTPGRDTSVVVSSLSGSVTFVVDANGLVSMSAPTTGTPGTASSYVINFTIEDEAGTLSEEGSYTVEYLCL